MCGEHFEQKMFLNDLQNRLHSHAIPRHFISECTVSFLYKIVYYVWKWNILYSLYYILDDTPSSSSSISRKLDFCSTVDNNISNTPAECETTILSSPNVLALPLDSRTPSNY